MKKYAIALLATLVSSAALAGGPIGYPGQTWGVFTFPSSVIRGANNPENNNYLYQGKVTQGVDWLKLGSDQKWTLDTYGSFGFSVDKNRLDYNDKLVPALGVKLSRSYDRGVIDVGVEGIYEHHFGNIIGLNGNGQTIPVAGNNVQQNGYGVQAYVSYWFGWNAK